MDNILDSSIYGALTFLSQLWKQNYPLIDFKGNNGSQDGHKPAASRYTECRLSQYGMLMVQDIESNTVNWVDNFDERLKEPERLPGLFPSLLTNYQMGIGVGVATCFLPHTLSDIKRVIEYRIAHPNCTVKELKLTPTFPTGGTVIGKLDNIYSTGKGSIKVRCKYAIKGNKMIVTELPPYAAKPTIAEQIRELNLEEIADVTDESEGEGTKFIIEFSSKPNKEIIATLLSKTDLETSVSVNMTALVNGKPKLFNFLELLDFYITQQHSRLIKKSEYLLGGYSKDLEIQEGLLKALGDIDRVIKIIRNADTTKEAKEELIKKFNFSPIQVSAILDMRLAKLTKISLEEVKNKILELNELLDHWTKINEDETARVEMWKEELTCEDNRVWTTDYSTEELKETKKIRKTVAVGTKKDNINPKQTYYVLTTFGRGFLVEPKKIMQVDEDTFQFAIALKDGEQIYKYFTGKVKYNIVVNGVVIDWNSFKLLCTIRGKKLLSNVKVEEQKIQVSKASGQ